MADWAIVVSTVLGLITARGGPPRTSDHPPTRSPSSEVGVRDVSSDAALHRPTPDDPCEGQGRVEGVPSPYDTGSHTCTCTPVRGLDGRVTRMSVSCW